MNILVTGGAGFIGSNYIKYVLRTYPEYKVVNLDLLTYAGNLENLKDVEKNKNYTFVHGNICDRTLLKTLFERHSIDMVVNFAAESHVDRSITNPEEFLNTNILGTQALLDTAMRHWRKEPDNKYCREYKNGVKFLQVSTDEVYGSLGATGLFSEDTPLSPNSPYSVSKASADMLVQAYFQTFGLPVNITRCSNNYGPYQFPEKLIPLMINNCVNDKKLPVYGDGLQIRDWLYVEDHCIAIDTVVHKGKIGEVYNIGGNNEKANIEIVKIIIKILGKSDDLISYVPDRPGHDRRYAIDNTKIKTQLGWSPKFTFNDAIEQTIKWYLENTEWLNRITSGEYQEYYKNMYLQEIS
jgi:dTDP-glucose 4,6-dehydratase